MLRSGQQKIRRGQTGPPLGRRTEHAARSSLTSPSSFKHNNFTTLNNPITTFCHQYTTSAKPRSQLSKIMSPNVRILAPKSSHGRAVAGTRGIILRRRNIFFHAHSNTFFPRNFRWYAISEAVRSSNGRAAGAAFRPRESLDNNTALRFPGKKRPLPRAWRAK